MCWEDFVLSEEVRKLNCDHIYHEKCIVPWLELHGTCPVCRKSQEADGGGGGAADHPQVANSEIRDSSHSSTPGGRGSTTQTDNTVGNTFNSILNMLGMGMATSRPSAATTSAPAPTASATASPAAAAAADPRTAPRNPPPSSRGGGGGGGQNSQGGDAATAEEDRGGAGGSSDFRDLDID